MSTDKQLATLTAQCALAGVVLIVTTDDYEKPMYVVSRWALTRIFYSLDEVRAWLSHVTGKEVATHEVVEANIASLMGEMLTNLIDATAPNMDH